MGKSLEREPGMAFGLVRKLPSGRGVTAHIISNNPALTARVAADMAEAVRADVVVVEGGPIPGDNGSRRSFGQINWDNCTSEWTPNGSAWRVNRPGHA